MHLKYNKLTYIFISKSQSSLNQISNKFLKNKINNKLIIQNFWQIIINKYLQEIIYLSPSHTLSESYINKLRKNSLFLYQENSYKKFLQKFNKDLCNNHIQILSNIKDKSLLFLLKRNNTICLQYNWLKILNFNLFNLKKYIQYIYSYFKYNVVNNVNKSLPFFILINNNNEIILSESSDQLYKNTNSLFFFSQLLKYKLSHKKIYTGLIFINPIDALEYHKHINMKYNSFINSNQIQVIPINMNLYLKLINIKKQNIEFRLIPDLKEISNLLYKNKIYKYLSQNISQDFGHNYFQGQPIYLIKPINAINKKNKNLKIFNYLFFFNKNNSLLKYEVVFFNYNTAINAWKNMLKNNKDHIFFNKPLIYISNLEKFIETSYYKEKYNKIIFLPSINTYKFLKTYLKISTKKQNSINCFIKDIIVYIRTFCYRLLWSLTSNQPINL
uniref:Uncharacterized protein n=1 Tax=Choreocolax polysiphoniae TaxID=282351 RepID=A0A0B5W2G9_9FLOR|nr:hypothetical protein [Choreocolax polysiphoniae]AJH65839.1 hypothetical protein [Choreocolax polysiphoniae]